MILKLVLNLCMVVCMSVCFVETVFGFGFVVCLIVFLRSAQLPKDYVHIFLNAGDDGPDQRGTRRAIHSAFASRQDFGFQLFFSVLCLKHQFHLAVRSQLKLCDASAKKWSSSWKYFSSVATLSHVWRAHLAKIRKTWWNQHGDEPGIGDNPATFKTPPLAIAGRWASIDSFSVHYLSTIGMWSGV